MRKPSTTGFSRRGVLKASAAGAALGATASLPSRADGSSGPNIVLIVTDQWSGRAIGAHGYDGVSTPNVDRMIAAGRSVIGSYCSDPACCPARGVLLTGRMGSENGCIINPFPLRDDVPDLGSWLKETSGYRPVYMGKWHIPGRPVGQAFDLLSYYSGNGENCDIALARSFEGFLTNYTESRPFFSVLSLYNPHDIVYYVTLQRGSTDPADYGLTADDLPDLPPNFVIPEEAALMSRVKRASSDQSWSEAVWKTYRWLYNRQVEMADGVVGRILDLVWNSRFAEDTMVILTADHGDAQGEHLLVNKQSLYEGASRVPFVVAWPGEYPAVGIDDQALVSGADIVPTVCDLAGISAPPNQRGVSLRPLFEGDTFEREYVPSQSLIEGRMIRSLDYKYIQFRNDPVEQLFNLRDDPWELNNLAGDSAYAAILDDHRRMQDDFEGALDNTALSIAGYDAVQEALANGDY
ncbi:MAG: sulfatase-like hydrolase/transferase [Myxococcota bacterium]